MYHVIQNCNKYGYRIEICTIYGDERKEIRKEIRVDDFESCKFWLLTNKRLESVLSESTTERGITKTIIKLICDEGFPRKLWDLAYGYLKYIADWQLKTNGILVHEMLPKEELAETTN